MVDFLPAISLNVSFFKEQGECRKTACAERQPKCGAKSSPVLGWFVGLGVAVGTAVGTAVGAAVGVAVGSAVGVAVGSAVGVAVGSAVGVAVGSAVGVAVGSAVGVAVGSAVGVAVGSTVGVAVGSGVGVSSGAAMVKVVFSPSPSRATDKSLTDVPEDEGYFTEPVTAVTL